MKSPVCSHCGMETRVLHLNGEQCIAACRARIGELEWQLEKIERRRRTFRKAKAKNCENWRDTVPTLLRRKTA